MTNNSEISIDNLIKRIYKSYVEIKVGDFREIDRDMLLSDIGLLYTNIKNLYPSTDLPLIEFELEQKNIEQKSITEEKKYESKVDAKSETVDTPLDIVVIEPTKIESVKNEESSTKIDLSMFEDAEDLEIDSANPSELTDKKSDNTSSPILTQFQVNQIEEKSTVQDINSVPEIEQNEEIQQSENKDNIDTSIQKEETSLNTNAITPDIEQDKKSKNSIMDFLHHNEKKETRDIYSFLDINTRIGLIELFFKGNSLELTECLVKLNKLTNREDCIKVIDKFAATFGVDQKEDIYKQFVNLVDRKLSY